MSGLVLPFLLAGLVSLVATRVCEAIAWRTQLVTPPREDRWHRRPVPLLGGAAIIAGTLVSLGFVEDLARFGVFLGLALLVGCVGLVDDVWPLAPQVKLASQVVLAGLLIQHGFVLRLTSFPVVNVFLTLFWVVGVTNAFNLLDNMDGLAAGMAALVAAFRTAFFLIDGDSSGATLTASFMGAALGFLVWNFPPARIFMGDVGSLFLGFFLAGVSLVGTYPYSRSVAAVLVFPILLMLIPLFDTAFVTATRLVTGRSVLRGGRDHTSHRLVALGIGERRALAFLFGISAVSGCLAILSYRYGFTHTLVLLVVLVLGLFLLAVHLARVTAEQDEASSAGRPIVQLVTRFPYNGYAAVVATDLVLIVTAYYAAYLLRFEGGFEGHREVFLATIGPVIVLQVSALAALGSYRGVWRYTSVPELVRLVRSVTLGVGASAAYLFLTHGSGRLSPAVFVLDWLLLVVLLAATRLSFRLFDELLRPARGAFRPVLIYGAGDGGELTLRELRSNTGLRRVAVGFLDDDPAKAGTRIHDVPVLGSLTDVERLITLHGVAEVIVASGKISGDRVQRLEAMCAPRGVAVVRAVLRLE